MTFKIESNSTSADCIVINSILGQHDLNILMKLFGGGGLWFDSFTSAMLCTCRMGDGH